MQIRRGDVFYAAFPSSGNSHLQNNKRPWLVIQNDIGNYYSPTTIVAPLTTNFKRLDIKTHIVVTADNLQPSVVMLEQIRTVDVPTDWEFMAHLSDEAMSRIDEGIKISLGLV